MEDLSLFGMMCPIFQQTEDSIKVRCGRFIIVWYDVPYLPTNRGQYKGKHIVYQWMNDCHHDAYCLTFHLLLICNVLSERSMKGLFCFDSHMTLLLTSG